MMVCINYHAKKVFAWNQGSRLVTLEVMSKADLENKRQRINNHPRDWLHLRQIENNILNICRNPPILRVAYGIHNSCDVLEFFKAFRNFVLNIHLLSDAFYSRTTSSKVWMPVTGWGLPVGAFLPWWHFWNIHPSRGDTKPQPPSKGWRVVEWCIKLSRRPWMEK